MLPLSREGRPAYPRCSGERGVGLPPFCYEGSPLSVVEREI